MMRFFLLLSSFFILFLTGCKPTVITELYLQDIESAFSKKEVILTPARAAIPISSVQNCDRDRHRIEDILEPYSLNLEFVQCKKLSGEIHDIAEYQMDVQIFNPNHNNQWNGIFAFAVFPKSGPNGQNSIVKILVSNNMKTIEEKFRDEFLQSAEGINLKIIINNDLSKEKYLVFRNVFVNGYPIDTYEKVNLKRRDHVEVQLSDVRMNRFMIENEIGLFSFTEDEKLLNITPEFKGNI